MTRSVYRLQLHAAANTTHEIENTHSLTHMRLSLRAFVETSTDTTKTQHSKLPHQKHENPLGPSSRNKVNGGRCEPKPIYVTQLRVWPQRHYHSKTYTVPRLPSCLCPCSTSALLSALVEVRDVPPRRLRCYLTPTQLGRAMAACQCPWNTPSVKLSNRRGVTAQPVACRM